MSVESYHSGSEAAEASEVILFISCSCMNFILKVEEEQEKNRDREIERGRASIRRSQNTSM